MTTVAVVGARGYVGRALCAALEERDHVRVIRVTRETYAERRAEGPFDVLVNAGMPSGRYSASRDPHSDFAATVALTADLVHTWTFGHFVQISTVSARSQLDTVYGRHKAAAERLCPPGISLVVRLGPMYSDDLDKGVLIDMLHGRPVYVAGESRYCFAPRDFSARWIAANLERRDVVEIGARDAITLAEVAQHVGASSTFEGSVDHQEIEHPDPAFPAACEVLDFMRGRIR
jgi:nucleoside-diphosphate-sugar epimerase